MATAYPPELERFIEDEVASGKYRSEEEVVCAALRLLREREARLQALRDEILPALEELDRGEGRPLDVEAILAWGRQRLAATGRANECQP